MRHWIPDGRGLPWVRSVWPVFAVLGLLISLAVPAEADDGSWDPTLPPVISAGAPGDPLAVANQSLQATANATQTTMNLGRQFLSGLGINLGGDDGGGVIPSKIPRANGRQAIEYVIRRGASQMGVPYSWGGGGPRHPPQPQPPPPPPPTPSRSSPLPRPFSVTASPASGC